MKKYDKGSSCVGHTLLAVALDNRGVIFFDYRRVKIYKLENCRIPLVYDFKVKNGKLK